MDVVGFLSMSTQLAVAVAELTQKITTSESNGVVQTHRAPVILFSSHVRSPQELDE